MSVKESARMAAERIKREEKAKRERLYEQDQAFKRAVELGAAGLGISEGAVAETLGIAKSTLSAWKRTPGIVPTDRMRQLVDLFGWDADTLSAITGAKPAVGATMQLFMAELLQAANSRA